MAEVPEGQRRLMVVTRALGTDRVRISLEDTGPGIPAEVLPKIFDPLVTTKGSAGTGLGLSISYGIIREHGGHITADSRPAHGAPFPIDLPVARGTAVGHRFIFITAGPVGEEADRALRAAGAALLYKPFTGPQFLDAVRATAG